MIYLRLEKMTMNESKLKIGNVSNHAIYLDIKNTVSNSHIKIIGSSGYGKTCLQQILIHDLSTLGASIIVWDMSGCFSRNQIKSSFLKNIYNWNICERGLPFNFFSSIDYDGKIRESNTEAANRLSDILSKALKVGDVQKITLYEGILDVLNNEEVSNSSNPYFGNISWLNNSVPLKNFNLLEYYLYERNRENKENVLLKLMRLSDSKILCPSSYNISDTIIFSLPNTSDDIKNIVTDVFLWMIWNRKTAKEDNIIPLYIIIDEFQNLNFQTSSPFFKILNEGRKYGINLILSTQFTKGRYNKMQLSALGQVGTNIYFHPSDDEISALAKDIDPSSPKKWISSLQTLQRGEAIIKSSFCYFDHSHKPYKLPLKIKIRPVNTLQ